MSDVKRWELECEGELMRKAGAPIPDDGEFVVLASDYDALLNAVREHFHVCARITHRMFMDQELGKGMESVTPTEAERADMDATVKLLRELSGVASRYE